MTKILFKAFKNEDGSWYQGDYETKENETVYLENGWVCVSSIDDFGIGKTVTAYPSHVVEAVFFE